MDTIYLTKPDLTMAEQIISYRQAFLDDGSSLDGCGSLKRLADPRDWLAQVQSFTDRKTVPANWVLSTQFAAIRESDQTLVGMIQVRHEFNDFLEKYGGNIGYSVRPCERKKGYATRMLHDCLPYCKELGLNRILVTCLEENEGSRKVILSNGGVYESTVFEPKAQVFLQRYWITL